MADEKQKTMVDVADKVVDKIGDGASWLASGLEHIVKTMSEQAPVAWKALVMYHRSVAISELVISVLLNVVGVFLVFFAYKGIKKAIKTYEEDNDDDKCGFSCVAFGVIGLTGFIIVCCNINDVPKLVADSIVPERRAVIEVVELAGKLVKK